MRMQPILFHIRGGGGKTGRQAKDAWDTGPARIWGSIPFLFGRAVSRPLA